MVYKGQRHWGWASAIEMYCSSLAAGTYLVSVAPYLVQGKPVYATGAAAAVALVLVSMVLLLVGMPSLWLAPVSITNLKSPQARGAIGLIAFTLLSIATWIMGFSGSAVALFSLVAWLGAMSALVTMTYPGIVMGSMKSIPFWNGAIPLLLVLSTGVLSGAALVAAMGGPGITGVNLDAAIPSLLLIYAVILLAHLAAAGQGLAPARASVRLLRAGGLSLMFWIGVVVAGIALPMTLFAVNLIAPWGPITQAGAVFVLAGVLLCRYCMLASGIKAPPIREDAITATYWLTSK